VCTLPGEVNAALYLQRTLLYSPVCCSRLHLTALQFLEATFEVLDTRPCQQGQRALTHSGVDPLHPLVAASINRFVISVTGGTHNSHVNQCSQQKQTEIFVYTVLNRVDVELEDYGIKHQPQISRERKILFHRM